MIPSKQIASFITAGVLLTSGANAQQTYKLNPSLPKPIAEFPNHSQSKKRIFSDQLKSKKISHPFTLGTAAISGTKVGSTYYDLQTNASMPNRLAYYDEGNNQYVHMGWTATSGNDNQTRGSFYTKFDVSDTNAITRVGSGWERVESERTGWTSVINLDGNIPAFVSHRGGPGTLVFATHGETAQQTDIAGTEGALWPRAAVDMNGVIHVIYTYNGQAGDKSWKLGYVRSTDNGVNWSTETFIGENVNQGDAYAIDARSSNVAVIYADKDFSLYLRKSSNNGAAWTEKQLVAAPNYSDATEISALQGDSVVFKTNTVETPGANMDVILDDEGVAHCVFNIIPTYRTGTGLKNSTTGEITRIGMDSIPVEEVKSLYYPELGMYAYTEGIAQLTLMAPPAGGTFDGNGTVISRQYGSGFSRYPQLGIDENNVLYCVYSSVKNGDSKTVTTGGSDLTGLFGHIYATHKTPTSVWSAPVDLTENGKDCLFPSLANTVVKNRMFISYSMDNTPGDYITNADLPVEEVDVYFSAVPTSTLNPFVLSADNSESVAGASVEVFPNPARNTAQISLSAEAGTHVEISIHNLLGENVLKVYEGNTITELTRIPLDTAHLAAGGYFCRVTASGKTIVKYFIVIP